MSMDMPELARHLAREIEIHAEPDSILVFMIADENGSTQIIHRVSKDDVARLFVGLAYDYTFEKIETVDQFPIITDVSDLSVDPSSVPEPVAARDSVVLSVD